MWWKISSNEIFHHDKSIDQNPKSKKIVIGFVAPGGSRVTGKIVWWRTKGWPIFAASNGGARLSSCTPSRMAK